jgi:pyruvate dehydrogenase E2 component (dihydrolipoamide acetyltransferase)
MAEVIRMPLLSDTMKEGKIAAWLKNIGDTVKSDDVLAEVETDKATMEVIGYEEGTLLYKGADEGKAVLVNGILAVVGKPGENIDALITQKTTVETPAVVTNETQTNATEAIKIPKELEVIQMPLLSDTMKEGKIATWLKQVGDTVKSDDVIAEVETDKATMEVIGYADGTLLYQGAEVGKGVLVNGTLAVVGPKDFDITPFISAFTTVAVPAKAAEKTPEKQSPIAAVAPVAPNATPIVNNGRVIASPLAKKLASEKGLDLRSVNGSGDGGRIIMRDVVNANVGASTTASPKAMAPSFDASIMQEGHHDVELTQMRKIIAQRLGESKFSAPHFYLKISVALDNLLETRKQLNVAQPVKVSINDMIIKACALSLRKHPDVNVTWMGDTIRYNHHIHIGSAIALPDGLIVPVIKFADAKTLPQIASDANVLYDKAKSKKIQPVDFTGNTFTVSNLGMMDIEEFTAIINPPDAAILAVGKGTPTPVVDEKGNMVVKTILKLTLSCDHRAIDGAVGATFLQTLKGYLENPIAMFL